MCVTALSYAWDIFSGKLSQNVIRLNNLKDYEMFRNNITAIQG